MKVFISWSGETSHNVALALRDWLPLVLQSVEPYVSSEDIEKGARWDIEVASQLDGTAFGILCVTADNLGSPWLNFEAGALSKSMHESRVSPFLLGLRPAELVGPLAQFQAVLPQFDDMMRLLKTMNSMSERPIDEVRLLDTATTWWPRLEERLAQSLTVEPTTNKEVQRDIRDMIEELLEIARGNQTRLVRSGIGTRDRQNEIPDEERGASEKRGNKTRIVQSGVGSQGHQGEVLDQKRGASERLAKIRADFTAVLMEYGFNDVYVTPGSRDISIVFSKPPTDELQSKLETLARSHGLKLKPGFRVTTPRNSENDPTVG